MVRLGEKSAVYWALVLATDLKNEPTNRTMSSKRVWGRGSTGKKAAAGGVRNAGAFFESEIQTKGGNTGKVNGKSGGHNSFKGWVETISSKSLKGSDRLRNSRRTCLGRKPVCRKSGIGEAKGCWAFSGREQNRSETGA